MRYKNNNYFIENISLNKLAIKYSTPLYCYSYNKLRSNIINFFTYFKKFSPIVCFAIKSNTKKINLFEIKFAHNKSVTLIGKQINKLHLVRILYSHLL